MKFKGDVDFWDLSDEERQAFALAIRCRACGRPAGRPCLAMNGNRSPVEMVRVHYTRQKSAVDAYRVYAANMQKRASNMRERGRT